MSESIRSELWAVMRPRRARWLTAMFAAMVVPGLLASNQMQDSASAPHDSVLSVALSAIGLCTMFICLIYSGPIITLATSSLFVRRAAGTARGKPGGRLSRMAGRIGRLAAQIALVIGLFSGSTALVTWRGRMDERPGFDPDTLILCVAVFVAFLALAAWTWLARQWEVASRMPYFTERVADAGSARWFARQAELAHEWAWYFALFLVPLIPLVWGGEGLYYSFALVLACGYVGVNVRAQLAQLREKRHRSETLGAVQNVGPVILPAVLQAAKKSRTDALKKEPAQLGLVAMLGFVVLMSAVAGIMTAVDWDSSTADVRDRISNIGWFGLFCTWAAVLTVRVRRDNAERARAATARRMAVRDTREFDKAVNYAKPVAYVLLLIFVLTINVAIPIAFVHSQEFHLAMDAYGHKAVVLSALLLGGLFGLASLTVLLCTWSRIRNGWSDATFRFRDDRSRWVTTAADYAAYWNLRTWVARVVAMIIAVGPFLVAGGLFLFLQAESRSDPSLAPVYAQMPLACNAILVIAGILAAAAAATFCGPGYVSLVAALLRFGRDHGTNHPAVDQEPLARAELFVEVALGSGGGEIAVLLLGSGGAEQSFPPGDDIVSAHVGDAGEERANPTGAVQQIGEFAGEVRACGARHGAGV